MYSPSQPPPSQGEGLIEILTNITEQFPPQPRGNPLSQPPPSQGEGSIEILTDTTEQFPPLPRGKYPNPTSPNIIESIVG
jgi:hypothetical protein